MPYISNSDVDFREMLEAIGVNNFEELIRNIPESLRLKGELNIPEAQSELEVSALLDELAAQNKNGVSFLGGGVYDHYVPAAVEAIIGRAENYTAYTPYQPEVSQGNLQAIYEFQSMICALTGMDVTNASMYEGGSALAEAVILAASHTRRKKVLVAGTLNPRYREVLDTYIRYSDIEIVTLPVSDLCVSVNSIKENLDENTAAVVMQSPNYFGFIEDMQEIGKLLTDQKALFISYYDPISTALLTPPAEYLADIAVAEGQVLGNRQNYGGPFVGLFSAKQDLVRKMPGRITGVTRDAKGRRGFVLTLQTREQHIRREKATSNICTNSGLMALAATVYLSLLGKNGIKEVANLCVQKAHYLAKKLEEIPGVSLASPRSFFKEFTIHLDKSAELVLNSLQQKGIFGGIKVAGRDDRIIIAVTEKRTRKELDDYISGMRDVMVG